MLLKINGEWFIFLTKAQTIFLGVLTFVSLLSIGSFNGNFHLPKGYSLFLTLTYLFMKTAVQDFVCHKLLFSINKATFRI